MASKSGIIHLIRQRKQHAFICRSSNKDFNNDIRNFLPRSVKLVRKKPSDQLGFNIRGGREHSSGIYISKGEIVAFNKFMARWLAQGRSLTELVSAEINGACGEVLPNTDAQRLGLQEGDQILQVNGITFDDMEHADAVRILKRNAEIQMFVKYFPFGYDKTYIKTRVPSPIGVHEPYSS